MTPGPSEEVGKVAIGVIDALKNQPLLIMLIIFNLLFLGAVGWAVSSQRSYQHELMKAMLEQMGQQTQLLAHCAPRP